MITETDSLHTYEFKDYYIILNEFNFTGRGRKKSQKLSIQRVEKNVNEVSHIIVETIKIFSQ